MASWLAERLGDSAPQGKWREGKERLLSQPRRREIKVRRFKE